MTGTTWFFVGFFTGAAISGVSMLILWFFIEPSVFRWRMRRRVRPQLPRATWRGIDGAIRAARRENRIHLPGEL